MAEKKPQPKNPADFEEAIKATKSKKGLETLRRQAAEQGKSPETEKIIAAINAKIDSIRETGSTRKKKALEKGGAAAAKDVETINEKAETAATEVKEDADKKAAAAEHGTESKEGTGKFSKDYIAPELSDEKRATITVAIETGTDIEGTTPENEVVIIDPEEVEEDPSTTTTTTSTATSTTASTTTTPAGPGTTPGSTSTTEPVEPENPEDAEANEPKNLEEARAAFFAIYKEVEAKTSKLDKVGRFFLGDNKETGIFSSAEKKRAGIIDEYYDTKAVYQGFIGKEATKMLEAGKSKAEVEAFIYDELKAKQEALSKSPLVPEKVRGVLGKATGWYMRMPKSARMVTSTLIATGILVGVGKVGIAGAGAYAATRFTKAALGGVIGQGLVSLKNKFWNADKALVDIKDKAQKSSEEVISEWAEGGLGALAISDLEKIYQKRLDQEHRARVKHLAVDFGLRLLAGLGTGAALDKTGVTGWMDDKLGGGTHHDTEPDKGGKKGGITPPKPPHPEPAPAPVPKPEDQYTFKEIKVEYSSKGSIDTWAHVKSQLKEAYKGIDASKIPPEYKHIMEARADALAKEFGEWRPDAADGKESLNMLKGSSIEFDKTGKIISHSLRTTAGGAEDQTLMDVHSAGNEPVISQQANERFFHYGGQASADNTVQAPFQDGTAGPTGIGDQVRPPFGGTDSNGFWNGSGQSHQFESHATAPSNGDDTPGDWREESAWDGKRHSKLWWKHHPDGHDYKAEARLAKRLAKEAARQAAMQQAPVYYPPYNASDQIDRAFYQTAVNSGGHSEFYPIGNPANPGGAPINYQHHEVYGAHLSGQQVDRILNNPVRFIGEDFLAHASHDPAYPLYKVMHDLQQHGYGFRPNESVAEYFARARTENQAYFAGLNVDIQDWFVRNGFYR